MRRAISPVLVAVLVAIASMAATAFAVPLQCSLKPNCAPGETDILHLYSPANAHAELPDQSSYNYKICCLAPGDIGLGTDCATGREIVELYSATNAHASQSSAYPGGVPACISPASSVQCQYTTSCSSLPPAVVPEASCLFSLYNPADSHVSDCSSADYPIKLCCWISDGSPPQLLSYNIEGCGYTSADTCWVRQGAATIHTTRERDTISTPNLEQFSFTREGCNPVDPCADCDLFGCPNMVSSQFNVDTGAASEPKVNNNLLDIGQPKCVESAEGFAARSNNGGGLFTDSSGSAWEAEQGYQNGRGYVGYVYTWNPPVHDIAGTADDGLYTDASRTTSTQQGQNYFNYSFRVPDGDYQVTLKFAELEKNSVGARKFDVSIEDSLVLDDFDVFAAAGGAMYKAVDRAFDVHVSDGVLDISFKNVADRALVNAILVRQTGCLSCFELGVNSGGSAYTDSSGRAWLKDQPFIAGTFYGHLEPLSYIKTTQPIQGAADENLYKNYSTYLSGSGSFNYTFIVPDGKYNVTLLFAQLDISQRIFDVAIEGVKVLNNFNITFEAGNKILRALIKNFTVQVSDGVLNISFIKKTGYPLISAIHVKQMDCATCYEKRVDTGNPKPFTGSLGNVWSNDTRYAASNNYGYSGYKSNLQIAGIDIAGTEDDMLYNSYIYGSRFNYSFHVPGRASYNVTLRFAETWFSTSGARVFDVRIEGVRVLQNFDIFAAAGGKNKAANRTFTVPITDSSVDIEFTSSVNNALINGIEVVNVTNITNCSNDYASTSWPVAAAAADGKYKAWSKLTDQQGQATGYLPLVSTAGTSWLGVDSTPPVTSVACGGQSCGTGWYGSDVPVTLSCSDAGSGCAWTKYCVDMGDSCVPATPYTGQTITVSENGMSYVRFNSLDNLGNGEAVHSVEIKIDKITPGVVNYMIDGSTCVHTEESDANNRVCWTRSGTVTTHTIRYQKVEGASMTMLHNITFINVSQGCDSPHCCASAGMNTPCPSEVTSSMNVLAIPAVRNDWFVSPTGALVVSSASCSNTCQGAVEPSKTEWTLRSGPGNWKFRVMALVVSEAMAASPYMTTGWWLGVDNAPPVTTATCNGLACTGSWTSSNIDVALTCNDGTGSGCDANLVRYCIDTGNTCNPDTVYSGAIAMSTEGARYVRFRSVDNVGNDEGIVNSILARIDRGLPQAWVHPLPLWTNESCSAGSCLIQFNVGWGGTDGNHPDGAGLIMEVQYAVFEPGGGTQIRDWTDWMSMSRNNTAVFGPYLPNMPPTAPNNLNAFEGKTIAFRIKATDMAGNIAPYAINPPWVNTSIDTVPPACAMATPVFVVDTAKSFSRDGVTWFVNGRYNVSWESHDTDSGVDSYSVFMAGGNYFTPVDITTLNYCNNSGLPDSGSSVACGPGTNNDIYNFTCIATDRAGNTGVRSPDITVRVDVEPPMAVLETPGAWIGHNASEWLAGTETFNLSWTNLSIEESIGSGTKCLYVQWANSTTDWLPVKVSGSECISPSYSWQAFGPPYTTLADGEKYYFRIRAEDKLGNAESWTVSGRNESGWALLHRQHRNATIDRLGPFVYFNISDGAGNALSPGYLDPNYHSSILIASNASDASSGVKISAIDQVIDTESLDEVIYTTTGAGDCRNSDGAAMSSASEHGGFVVCSVTIPFSVETSITFNATATDRAGNLNYSWGVVTTHRLSNFIGHIALLHMGMAVDVPVQVRNLNETAQDVTLALSGYSYAEFQPTDETDASLSQNNRVLTVSLASGEQRTFYARLIGNDVTDAPVTLNIQATSELGEEDSDSLIISVSYPPEFPAFGAAWAFVIMLSVAALLFYRTEKK